MTSRMIIGMAVAACLSTSGALHASLGNSAAAKQCQKGGWQTEKTGTGEAFTSEEACVAYAARGGVLYRPLLVAVPSQVVEDQGIDLYATGFHPNANAQVTIQDSLGGKTELFAI